MEPTLNKLDSTCPSLSAGVERSRSHSQLHRQQPTSPMSPTTASSSSASALTHPSRRCSRETCACASMGELRPPKPCRGLLPKSYARPKPA
nr:hypothetical protein [Cressdnaviricota sp.]UOF81748.1 hypothetical protein [Cressdnaviricota sp.]UOF82483.1 hypothetical protein [Cressdnaviricota sp.]UOF82949.1 hypothetical protein [Cressdnaviricota sp.]UOF82971.1 hypothetical protein [Cressdnaviricota sp.]